MNKPAISISTAFNYAIPLEQQMPLVAEAGFSHVSLVRIKSIRSIYLQQTVCSSKHFCNSIYWLSTRFMVLGPTNKTALSN